MRFHGDYQDADPFCESPLVVTKTYASCDSGTLRRVNARVVLTWRMASYVGCENTMYATLLRTHGSTYEEVDTYYGRDAVW